MRAKIANTLNRTLFELWIGIIFWGIVLTVILIFVPSKFDYGMALLMGVAASLTATLHMWWSLDRALSRNADKAAKFIRIQFLLRYLFLIIILGISGLLFDEYVLASFGGILGMKVAAYLQPFSKKISTLIYGVEILPDIIYEDEEAEEAPKIEDTAEGQR